MAAKPIVIVVGGFLGSQLLTAPGLLSKRSIWLNAPVLATWGPDLLDLAPDGISPGPLALWNLQPGGPVFADVYTPLWQQLFADGWDTHFAGFDWRLSIQVIGPQLAAAISKIVKTNSFWVIGHSYGGLAARAAFTSMAGGGVSAQWERLVGLGVPHGGSYQAALGLASYYGSPSFLAMIAQYVGLGARIAVSGLAGISPLGRRLQQVIAHMPGLYSLLPSNTAQWAALDPNVAGLYLQPAYEPSNPYVTTARLNAGVADLSYLQTTLTTGNPPVVNVVGIGFPTVNLFAPSGDPSNVKDYGSTPNGDGVVPASRAVFPNAGTMTVTADHSGLAQNTDVLSRITDLLQNGLSAPTTVAPTISLKPPILIDDGPPPNSTIITPVYPPKQYLGDP